MSSALFVRKQSILLISSHFRFLLALAAQAYALKEENDSLRWQLDAYRNEVELLKQEKGQLFRTEESLTKDQQLQFLQQTMQGMQQVLLRKRKQVFFFRKVVLWGCAVLQTISHEGPDFFSEAKSYGF